MQFSDLLHPFTACAALMEYTARKSAKPHYKQCSITPTATAPDDDGAVESYTNSMQRGTHTGDVRKNTHGE